VTYFLHTVRRTLAPQAAREALSQGGRPFQEIKPVTIQLIADFRRRPAPGMVLAKRGISVSARKP
jgi:hypothetical protein